MCFETVVSIISLAAAVICYAGYRYCCENVYLRYAKDKKSRPGAGTSKGDKANYCSATIARKRREINDRY